MTHAQSKALGTNYKEMLLHFCSTIYNSPPGKVLLSAWLLGIGGMFYGAYRKAQENKKLARLRREIAKRPDAKRVQNDSFNDQLKRILKIAIPSVTSKPAWHLFAYTVLLCARIMLTIQIARVTGRLGKTVGARSFDTMFRLQAVFGLWCIPAAIVNSLLHFENSKLGFSMREQLVVHAHKSYFPNLVYYRAANLGTNRIEDVDQRVSGDIKKFCSQFADVYGNLLKPILEVIFVSQTLTKLMGGKQLAGFFVFFIVSGFLIRGVMPPFSAMTAETQRREGRFLSHHHRIITNAEEIAFYGGGERERVIVESSFFRVKRLFNKIFRLRLYMNILDQYLVKHGASMVAYSMMMPAVYLGLHGLKGKSAPEIMEYYITSTSLFIALGTACKNLLLSYKRIQDLAGLSVRVSELFDMLHKRAGGFDGREDIEAMKRTAFAHQERRGGPPQIVIGDHIEFKDVDLFSPTGALLVKGLNFAVKKNSNVLISGPNGSGKSSLFRVLGGLWPVCAGTLIKPAKEQLFYIPQQPYLAPGTLRDQVTYPLSLGNPSEDGQLLELMRMVNLEYLVDREGGWDSEREWGDVLSGGEKQRVAMARLFYHKPAFGILDECTSAVSMDVEGQLYETCKRLGITIFTVSHRPQLRHHHDYQLRFDGEGGWEWNEISDAH